MAQKYYHENKEKVLAKMAEFRRNNPELIKARKKKYYVTHAEQIKAKQREYNVKNKAKRDAYNKARYERIRLQERNRRIEKSFGLTPEQVNDLYVKQHGRCGICKKQFLALCGIGHQGKQNRPHIDHDHQTNKVRGLLCPTCNLGIGYFYDSAELLRSAIAYLESPPFNG